LDLPGRRPVLDAHFLKEFSDAYAAIRFGSGWSSLAFDALYQASWVPPVGLLGIYLVLLFPDGRLPSRRWRPFTLFAGAVIALICLLLVLVPGPVEGHAGSLNPFGLVYLTWMGNATIYVILLLPVCIVVSAFSLVLRFRHSGAEVREQIKWVAFAACLVGSMYLVNSLAQLFFAPESLQSGNAGPAWTSLILIPVTQSYPGVPVAIGFAVLKYHLYDTDIIINRALVYGSLTLMILLVYFGSVARVVTVQTLFRTFTGQQQQPQLAVAVSTLAIAALFNPLRRRVQRFIDSASTGATTMRGGLWRRSPPGYGRRRTWTV
jgi:hypothetical protein